MWVSGTQFIRVLLAAALFHGAVQAQPANPPISEKELIIATKEAPPFVMKHPDGTLHGISIDLWRRIADRSHLRCRFSEHGFFQAVLVLLGIAILVGFVIWLLSGAKPSISAAERRASALACGGPPSR